MASAFDLVCVGRVVRETIYFPTGTRGPVLGSPPAYCSVVAARQGARVGLVTKVGSDMPGALLEPIFTAGVDTTGLLTSERTTVSELIYDREGRKEIRYPSMSPSIGPQDIPPAYEDCQILYVCPMDNDVLPEDLAGVVAKGQMSAVDLGGYGGVHMSKATRQALTSPADLAREVASHFDIVKASDEDAAAIFGRCDVEHAARSLLACGPEVVVITQGSEGALVCSAQGLRHVPVVPSNVKDTTGGGDAFMAGFLLEYLRSSDPLRAAQWGCATAAYVIEQSGGVRLERMPTHAQVEARFERAYHAMGTGVDI